MENVFDSKVVEEIKDEPTWQRCVDDAEGPVMVEFFVTWCPHCQREAPILDEVAPAIKEAGVDVYHANAEVMYTKGDLYGLTETPSFILVEGGKLLCRHEGFLTADELMAFSQGKIDDAAPAGGQSPSSAAF